MAHLQLIGRVMATDTTADATVRTHLRLITQPDLLRCLRVKHRTKIKRPNLRVLAGWVLFACVGLSDEEEAVCRSGLAAQLSGPAHCRLSGQTFGVRSLTVAFSLATSFS